MIGLLQKLPQPWRKNRSLPQAGKPLNSFIQQLDRYSPLLHLQEQRQIVEVTTSKTNLSYQSIILETDIRHGQAYLDNLFPAPTVDAVEKGDWLRLRHQNKRKILDIDTQVLNIDSQQTPPIIKVQLPEEVDYQDRRQGPRLSLDQHRSLAVRLQFTATISRLASALNIAADGLRLSLGGNQLTTVNNRFPIVAFQFNQDFQIQCRGEIKASHLTNRPNRRTLLSIKFSELPQSQRAQLLDYISQATITSLG